MRGINERFIADLKSGLLNIFLLEAKNNKGICLEIRADYINLYYKGGNALKVSQSKSGYTFSFDSKYCKNKGDERNYEYLSSLNKKDSQAYSDALITILFEMDSWFAYHPKAEREYQHNLIKNNTLVPAIIDIEYAGRTRDNKLFRLDMLGIIKTENGYKLIIFENKYGNGAISGNAGLRKHYEDIVDILTNIETKRELISSVVNIVNNKFILNILDFSINESDITDIEILFLLTNFNIKSKAIANEIKMMVQAIPAKLLLMDKDETLIDYNKARDIFAYGN